jgi:threonylcarbamoyladenosine tRNA methylthiotransferase MtaB
LILGTSEKYKVFDYLTSEEEQIIKIDQTNEFWEASTSLSGSHTRAFLKIQDGCNYVCSFCVIPFARGRSKAISVSEAIAKAKEIVGNGFKEIVLTGVNIGEYENSSGEKLSKLVKELLKIDGLERLRMSSVESNTITEELLEVLANSTKTCDHFHIPLQSGDDEILKLMRRKYTVADYTKTIEKIKKYFPNAGIGADVIVGFPGETEKQFQNTASLLAELPITHFHIFPFSRRKNTTAAMIPNQIHETVKNLRVKTLRNLGFEKLNSFSQQNVGMFGKVLFENLEENGLCEGYTTNYLRVYIKNDKNLKNELQTVKLTKFEDGKLIASLENDTKI